MTLEHRYSKWHEKVYTPSIAKYPERKNKFTTSSGIEIPPL